MKTCKRCKYSPKIKIHTDWSKQNQKLSFEIIPTCIKCGYENYKKIKCVECDFDDPIVKEYKINISEIKHEHDNIINKVEYDLFGYDVCNHYNVKYCSNCEKYMNRELITKFNLSNQCEHINEKLKKWCNNYKIQYSDLIEYINIKTNIKLNDLEYISENHKSLKCPKTKNYFNVIHDNNADRCKYLCSECNELFYTEIYHQDYDDRPFGNCHYFGNYLHSDH